MAMPLGERVRELRQEQAVGQAELARRLGRLPQDVYKWEHGRQIPSEDVPAVAAALGVSICDLYGVQEGHSAPPAPSVVAAVSEAVAILQGALAGAQAVPAPAQEFVPTAADRDTRDILRAWDAMPEDVQREWLEAAETLRREKSQK